LIADARAAHDALWRWRERTRSATRVGVGMLRRVVRVSSPVLRSERRVYYGRAVRGVVTVGAFLAQPVGQYLLGPTYLVWCSSPRLRGIVFWGRPEEDHIRSVIAAIDGHLSIAAPPHASLVDVRRVSAIDLAAFTLLLGYSRANRTRIAQQVRRQAVLRPDGLPGAAVAGFSAVLDPAYPIEVFTEPATALRWLGVADEMPGVAKLEEVQVAASDGSAFVAAVRAHLEQAPTATLRDTARIFALSPRNLQRRLADARTTFQFEETAARVRVAKTLLLDTNYDLKRIAIEVGCASLQNFSALFHKSTGESPSQWRARHRPADFRARHPVAAAAVRRDLSQSL
jgi:AraC-like DNA-binding protein